MTAFASAILAALPGVGVQPEKAGAGGATAADGVLGVFDALLAGLTGGDVGSGLLGDGAPDPDAKTAANDAQPVDPALAAASAVVLPFAPLTQPMPEGEPAADAAAPVGDGQSAQAETAPFMPIPDAASGPDIAVTGDVAPQAIAAEAFAGDAAATTQEAPTETPAQPQVAARNAIADEAPLFAKAAVQPAPPPPVEATVAPPATRTAEAAPAAAAAAPAPVPAPKAQAEAAPAPIAQQAAGRSAVPAKAEATPVAVAVVTQQGAPEETPAAAPAVTATSAPSAQAAVVVSQVPVPQTPAPRATVTQPEGRRVASTAAAAKNDQASAVSAYLDGLDGAAAKPSADAVAEVDAQADTTPELAPAPVEVAETDQPEGQARAAEVRAAEAPAAAHEASAPAASRASAETVAKLSADIVRKLDGQSSRFDLQLDPHGLGKVDVSIEIDRDGRLTAALSFDSAQAANDLKGRSGELRAALAQAGFDVSDSGLSFNMASQNGGGGRQAEDQSRGWSGRAFQTAGAALDEADARAALQSRSRAEAGGVDIRI